MTTTEPQPHMQQSAGNQPHLAEPDVNPSFTKGIFLGELREEFLFPYPELSAEEHESLSMILDSLRAFADEHVDSRRHDREGVFSDQARLGLHELGIMGLSIPEAYGGFGAPAKVFTRIFGELGGIDPALAVYFGAHQSIGCKGIILFGTDDQKQRYLPGCATGDIVAAFCLTEPGSGSDAQAMRTTAVPSEDGSHYVLNGNKLWISNAGYASIFTVFAKTPVTINGETKQRVTAFIVDAHAPGVTLGPIEHKMGIRASDTRPVAFENVIVPAADRLGEVGQGFKIALEILNSGRLGLACAAAHGTRSIMRRAIEYANTRTQFGKPIGSFEILQRKIAANAATCYALDAACFITAHMVDRGGIDYSLETAICKVAGAELVFRAANDALQIAGGIGYSAEFPYEQAVRDSRINLIFEGTDEILRILIALSGLQEPGERLKAVGAAFQRPLQSIGVIGSYLADRAKQTIDRPKLTRVHPSLSHEAGLVSTMVHDFARGVESAIMHHGKEIIDRQIIQERMADVAIDVYLATAALSRASATIARTDLSDEAKASEVDCAKLFVSMAAGRTRQTTDGLRDNDDDLTRAVAERALTQQELVVPAIFGI